MSDEDRPGAEDPPRNQHEERSQATRLRILDAAQAEFVACGLEGARIETVARRAGVNKALVYRHFTGKEALFLAVLERCYQAIRHAEAALELPADPLAALDRLCGFTLDYYIGHPDLLVLVGIENLHGGRHIRQAGRAATGADDLVGRMRAIVARGEAAGVMRPRLDPAELWLMLSALCWSTVANAHTSDFTFGIETLSPERVAIRLDNIRQMIRRFVAA